jgi:RNA polymerase sigma-70 factor (ECF subfamily)
MSADTSHPLHDLYVNHHGWLQSWLRRRLDCSADAADLSHDTFLKMLLNAERVALRQPRAYLATIARGLLINFWRRRELEQAWLDALAVWPEALAPSPEQREIWLEALLGIDTMLRQLPVKVRTAFLLAQLDGLKYRDIAQRLDVSERMVKKYMAQAMLHCLAFEDALHEH